MLRGTPVLNIEQDRVHLKLGSIESKNIIWAAGIKASLLLDSLKVEQDRSGRVIVSDDLSILAYPDIFYFGRCSPIQG